jgi:hypothetical protein
MKYGVCILCDRMKEEEDSRGKGPINGNTCQCPDALTCEHCKDKVIRYIYYLKCAVLEKYNIIKTKILLRHR